MSKFASPSDATGRIATPFPLSLYQGLLKEIKPEKPPNNFINLFQHCNACSCFMYVMYHKPRWCYVNNNSETKVHVFHSRPLSFCHDIINIHIREQICTFTDFITRIKCGAIYFWTSQGHYWPLIDKVGLTRTTFLRTEIQLCTWSSMLEKGIFSEQQK